MSFKNDLSHLLQPWEEGQQYKKNTPFIFDRMYLFGMQRDSFSAYYVCI